ncbi:MAG: hypothetical protein ACXWNR_02850 [Candidatus Limnocylindrales bacterium]
MREGRKPRRLRPVEAAEIPNGPPPAAAGDQSGIQLPLASPEESEEILVRVSTDGLDAAEPGVAEPGVEPGVADPPAESVADPPAETVTVPVAEAWLLPEAAGLPPEPSAFEPAGSVPADDPSLQMRIARIQLRTGALTTARAQLETLSGRNLLDTAGAVDLAEARWRTGDLHGAGEAAVAYLEAGGGEALGFVIAAEAAYLAGHTAEARRYMDEAQLRMLTSLESIFAGIPRKAPFTANGWEAKVDLEKAPAADPPVPIVPAVVPPVVPAVAPAVVPAVVPAEPRPIEPAPQPQMVAAPKAPATGVEPEPTPPEAVLTVTDAAPPERAAPDAAERVAAESSRADAQTEVAAGVALLETGDALMAALHFGIALRMAADSAPEVLAAIGDRRNPALELVRGDALRIQGHESDAGQAYRSVASALNAARAAAEMPAQAASEPNEEAATDETSAEPPIPTTAEAPQEPDVPATRTPEPPPPISWSD